MFLQFGDNALNTAAFGGQSHIVRMMLDKYPDMIKQTNNVSEQIIQLLYSKQYIDSSTLHNYIVLVTN